MKITAQLVKEQGPKTKYLLTVSGGELPPFKGLTKVNTMICSNSQEKQYTATEPVLQKIAKDHIIRFK